MKFKILLEIGCNSTIFMGRLIKKLTHKVRAVMQWYMQADNINTNLTVKTYLTLPVLIAAEMVTWNFHVDDTTKGRYDMILGRDILKTLGLNLKLFDYVIESDYGSFKELTPHMVDLGMYEFKYLNIGNITPE